TDIEGDRLGPGRPLDEVRRRVEMGARVGAHVEPADIADRTVGDGDRQGDGVVRVAGKGWDTGLERNADVDPACGIEGGRDGHGVVVLSSGSISPFRSLDVRAYDASGRSPAARGLREVGMASSQQSLERNAIGLTEVLFQSITHMAPAVATAL